MQQNNIIENVILDLGGVIANLNEKRCEASFSTLIKEYSRENYSEFKKQLDCGVEKINRGEISGNEFCEILKPFCKSDVSLEEIRDAYISMIDVPESRAIWVKKLSEKFKLYLLSDISEIHWNAFKNMCFEHQIDIESLFDKCYLSYQCGMTKPNLQFYEYVIKDSQIDPAKTLYLDDLEKNIIAGKKAGIKYCLQVTKNKSELLYDMFS